MLQVKNLSFSVGPARKRSTILNNLSLKIKPGEFVVITGPNGSGKSTLAKLIMGLEKATDGQIIFNQQNITDKDITERARLGIAFAFQQPPHFKGVTVKDLLQISATGHETFLEDTETDYKKLIETVGLDESYLDREVEVLFEEEVVVDDVRYFQGYSREYIKVLIKSDDDLSNKIIVCVGKNIVSNCLLVEKIK